MLFSQCATHFLAIEDVSSRLAITQHLADMYRTTTAQEAAAVSYLVLGMIEPPYRAVPFSIAEKVMIDIIARVFEIEEARVKSAYKEVGDLGALFLLFSQEFPDVLVDAQLAVLEVYECLVACAHCSGTGSQEVRKNLMVQLLRGVSPLAAQYIARIVVGKLRLGFSEMTILDALSWCITGNKSLRNSLEDAYNRCADIGLIARHVKEHGADHLDTIAIQVGIPIRPAAAERLPDPAAIIERLGVCAAQPKFDGFRVQVHAKRHGTESKVWMFSRNLLPMDDMFPEIEAAARQLIALRPDIYDYIIEGEAMVYDENTQGFVPFQETVKRRRKHGVEEHAEQLPLRLVIFDVLWHNGRSCMDMPEHQRYQHLVHLIGTAVPTFMVSEQVIVHTAQELTRYFQSQISGGLEGVMVKRLDAIYQPGKRNYNWIKLKRHEEGSLEDTLDVVVLGYYGGRGKRAGFGIGALLVGVFHPRLDRFETIARIGTGLSDEQWRAFKKLCDEHAVEHKPDNVVCEEALYPQVWCTPEVVVIVRADEITQSPMHTAGRTQQGEETTVGYALRFPRYMGTSHDKQATDATTVEEIKHLYKHQSKLRGA